MQNYFRLNVIIKSSTVLLLCIWGSLEGKHRTLTDHDVIIFILALFLFFNILYEFFTINNRSKKISSLEVSEYHLKKELGQVFYDKVFFLLKNTTETNFGEIEILADKYKPLIGGKRVKTLRDRALLNFKN